MSIYELAHYCFFKSAGCGVAAGGGTTGADAGNATPLATRAGGDGGGATGTGADAATGAAARAAAVLGPV